MQIEDAEKISRLVQEYEQISKAIRTFPINSHLFHDCLYIAGNSSAQCNLTNILTPCEQMEVLEFTYKKLKKKLDEKYKEIKEFQLENEK